MKLQYRYAANNRLQFIVQLYCDGQLVNTYKVWQDKIDEEIDNLIKEGYTLGFTEEEIETEKYIYEEMLANIIK